jgi:hypothetical protein
MSQESRENDFHSEQRSQREDDSIGENQVAPNESEGLDLRGEGHVRSSRDHQTEGEADA